VNAHAAILTALDCLGDGDQAQAVEVLLAALEDAPRPAGCRCRSCGLRFDWPGLRDEHELRVHELEAAA
jgi:hypothetical protein